MSLTPGTRVGPYEIVSALGAGGMGEVYRARDTSLGREVAIKVLSSDVAHDPDRIARFRREAHILAALNHPLIASIYGIDDSGAAPALILELVEGPTLAQRIGQGAMPLDEALPIALQIGQALEAAHQQGIVHRDLKPANIKLRPDGTVKVLDFGLARALEPVATSPSSDLAATMSSPALTRLGVILGTAAYMSPEQARGHVVDRGADIWAFGAVLFEMLTGTRAFEGEDPTQTVASVLRSDPDWSQLPATTPESVRRVLRRCLEKDRRRRLGDIRDAGLDLEEAHRSPATATSAPGGIGRRERWLWMAAVAAAAPLAVAWLLTVRTGAPAPIHEARVEITTPLTPDPVSLAMSPDGQKLAFVAFAEGRTQLWVRMIDSGMAQPLRGTDGAAFPFWSPDSRAVGFFAAERVWRIGLDGTAPAIIGPAVIGPGGAWSRDGSILFPVVPDSPLFRVTEHGGPPVMVLPLDPARHGQRYPQFLPDGRHFLYFVAESRSVFLGSTDGSPARKLLESDAAAVMAPPAEVLFVRGGVLYAQRFDPERLQLEGEPVSLASGIAVHAYGGAAVSASATGTIAYRTGAAAQERQLVWYTRSGSRDGTVGEASRTGHVNLTLSPDDKQVAFNRTSDGNTDVWITDVSRGIPTPFTRSPTPDICPIWAPDGHSIVFSTVDVVDAGFALTVKSTVSDAAGRPLSDKAMPRAIAMDYSGDGRYVLYRSSASGNQWDIWAVATTPGATPFVVAQSRFDERTAQFSPDGRWIAYESNESGGFEIYVRPFPGPGSSTRVSTAGGTQPRWHPRGSELFYIAPDGRLMSVPATLPAAGTGITLGSPAALFAIKVTSTVQGGVSFEYDVSADGRRFLVDALVEQAPVPISLIMNRRQRP